jgi:hypothetical protein
MRETIAFACDFCGFISKRKWNTQRHEKTCWYNPANKTCVSCGFHETYFEDVYTGHQFGVATYNSKERINICNFDKVNKCVLQYNCKEYKQK